MNRPGRCTDNAIMESFWHSMKAELLYGTEPRNALELSVRLNRYIGDFYNTERLHSSLGYTSPVQFEANAA